MKVKYTNIALCMFLYLLTLILFLNKFTIKKLTLILELKRIFSALKQKLNKSNNFLNFILMFTYIMSPSVGKSIMYLQSFVNCLVSCSSNQFYLFVYHRNMICLMTYGIECSSISHIGFYLFSKVLHPFKKFVVEDHDVILFT